MEEVKTKYCNKCKIEKPVEDFYFQNKAKGYLHSKCKNCVAESDRMRYNDPEVRSKRKEREKSSEYRAKRKEIRSTPENKAKQKEYDRIKKNTPEFKAKQKERRSTPEFKAKQKDYYSTPKYRARVNRRQKERRDVDPSFKIITSLRVRQGQVIKGRISTTKGLGCSRQELLNHLESQFTEGMSFGNYGKGDGKWNLDHIDPISLHDKDENGEWCTKSERNKKLMHYTNLQPMWEEDNIKKGNKIQ